MTTSTWIELLDPGPASPEVVGAEERKMSRAPGGRNPGTVRRYWASQGRGKKKVKRQDHAEKEEWEEVLNRQ